MQNKTSEGRENDLPACVVEFIAQVTRKIRYRRKVRQDVQAELTTHFEDELRDCKTSQEREEKARKLIAEFGDPGLLAILCRRAKKRCRPLWRKVLVRSGQVLGVFVGYLVLCSLPLMLGKPTIRVNYIEWLNDRCRPDVADTANAKLLYDQAAQMYVKLPDSPQTKLDFGDAFARSRVEWLSGYSDQEKEDLAQWLKENQPALDMLRKASRMAYYWPAYDASVGTLIDPSVVSDSLQVLSKYRQVVFALREQIVWEASQGRIEDALEDCMVLRRFGRHLEDKGFLNDQLVGVSIESICYSGIALILDRAKVPEPLLVRLQQELEQGVDLTRQVVSLDGEKAFWYDNIQRRFTDNGHGGGHALKDGIPFAAGSLGGNVLGILRFDYPSRREAMTMVEDYFECAQGRIATVPNQRSAKVSWNELDPEMSLLLSIAAPAYGAVDRQVWRIKTQELATVTLVAIQRYARETGEYPATLDQLVERGYLEKLPADPYGRGPLTYRRTGGGFLLYSWGEDSEDDGGHWGTDSRGKPNRWAANGDWVFWPLDEV